MPRKRKRTTKPRAPAPRRGRPRIPREDVPKGKLLVADAAYKIRLTTQAIYMAIKRGDIKASKFRGQIVVDNKSLLAHHRRIIDWMTPASEKKPKKLTDEEFIARLNEWDPV